MVEASNMLKVRKVAVGRNVALVPTKIFHLIAPEDRVLNTLAVRRGARILEEARVFKRTMFLARRHRLTQ